MNHYKATEQSISVILADQPIPPDGPLNIEVHISTTLNISAEEARLKVNQFAHRDITDLEAHLQNGRPCIVFVRTRELPYWADDTDYAVIR